MPESIHSQHNQTSSSSSSPKPSPDQADASQPVLNTMIDPPILASTPSDHLPTDAVMLTSDGASSSSSLSMPTTPKARTRPNSRNLSHLSLPHVDSFLTQNHLKPGTQAELLSYDKTINLYRDNAKNDPMMQYELALFLYESGKRLKDNKTTAYTDEAVKILKQLKGLPEAQYYLANIYASGELSKSRKPDFGRAFPLFVQAAKYQHVDASYRAGKCYEDGLGCLKNKSKAIQYYRIAATLNHPGAMFCLGLAKIKGTLGLDRDIRDGEKWLKRSAVAATPEYPHALHELGLLHEKGLDGIIFKDTGYSVQLYKRAAELGYVPSAYRLGEIFEFGYLGCRKERTLSVKYYTIAARQGDPNACYALSVWYLNEMSEEKAVYWARLAAEKGLAKAEFAMGYFEEIGIGGLNDKKAAVEWYRKAAKQGDEQAKKRISLFSQPTKQPKNNNSKLSSSVAVGDTR